MKKRINTWLLLTVFLTLAATLGMAVAIFHNMYQRQILSDMQTYAALIQRLAPTKEEIEAQYTEDISGLRVTVISESGEVEYDSSTDGETLDNHADREEVQEAFEGREGYAVRRSDTLDRAMYYYAIRLEGGEVLRISKAEAGLWHVFTITIEGMIGISVLMLIICMLFSRFITRGIVRPIERLAEDINSVRPAETYEELAPFITTIQEQHEDILKGARMRQEFTANVSHELKTPLTAISGYAELIETGFAGENEIQRFGKEIHRNSRRLLTLINDIIRLSELDSDKLEMALDDVDLYSVASACVDNLELYAKQHGIRIHCGGVSCMVRANRGMLEELVYNLCDNAIRYNRLGGSVDVTVGRYGGRVMLCVKDTGIGIPQESQDRVFERFYRVDKSRSKNTGGTGLGLAIVKHIVAQHHAQIELKSEFGKGTEITVWFGENQPL